jgi:hypothetical protein
MKRALEVATVAAFLAAAAGSAAAQGSLASTGQLSAEGSIVEGPGIKLGEGLVLHPTVGLETGFLSNVFYEDTDVEPSGILRVLAELHLASLSNQRLGAEAPDSGEPDKGDFNFRAGLRVEYDEFISGNDAVQAQRDVGVDASVAGIVFPQGTWMFAFADNFRRDVRPTNYESRGGVDRDVNHLRLFLTYQPGGRALSATLRFQNTIDVFESESHEFANRVQNTLGLRVAWQWLPVTQFFADASIGYFTGLGDGSEKVTSLPLRLMVGTSTALTTTTTLNAIVGFGKGFYEEGADYTNVLFGAEFGWRYSPLGRVLLLYRYDFADSINANYYRDHEIKVGLDQQIGEFELMASADLRFRRYEGLPADVMSTGGVRDDLIFAAELGGRYHFREWLAATLDYRLVVDETDFRYTPAPGVSDDPSYVRHEIVAGILAAF